MHGENVWLDRDEGVVGYLNYHLLPKKLRAKVVARGEEGRSSLWDPDEEVDTRTVILVAQLFVFAMSYAQFLVAEVLLSFVADVLIGEGPFEVDFVWPLYGALIFVVGSVTHGLYKRRKESADRKRLSGNDEELIQQAVETFPIGTPVPAAGLAFGTDSCGCPNFVARVDEVRAEVFAVEAWHSEYLSQQRAEFDPAAEAAELIRAVVELHAGKNYLGERPSSGEVSAVMAAQEYDAGVAALHRVWASLVARLRRFELLLDAVRLLDRDLLNAEAAARAGRIAQMANDMVSDLNVQEITGLGGADHSAGVATVAEAVRNLMLTGPGGAANLKLFAPEN